MGGYVYGEAASASSHHVKAVSSGVAITIYEGQHEPRPMLKATIFVLVGLLGLVFGGEFFVDVAINFGMQERIIGLLIVGPGTSVPGLVTSIAAARKKDAGMVLGNVLGSNIFNVFFTLGATAVIKPIPLDLALNSVILIRPHYFVAYISLSKNKTLGRLMGAFLLAVYIGYIANALMS
ncbi:MAG: hypothetical protein KAG45_06080 [Methyloprofundus sp.]|nr:hypothetical protein [Methyloprofundus sp.]